MVVELALLLVVLAVFDAALSLVERWISARVGEGLIFDMRTQVFAHFQRMPVAFFTRTQTGALVSRLNSDVLDAQSAFTNTLSSVVGNAITVVVTLMAMLFLSWQITLLALVLFPMFVLPARWVGRRIQAITRESYNLNAAMTSTMTERFNVAGALLVRLFGQPLREIRSFEAKAGRVRDIGVTQAMFTVVFMTSLLLTASIATALVYGVGGVMAVQGALQVGTVVALAAYLNRLYGPLMALSNVQVSVMTALVSFDRIFEVLDLQPLVAETPDAIDIPRGPGERRVRARRLQLPDRVRGLARVAGVGRGAGPGAVEPGPPRRHRSPPRRASSWPSWARPAPARRRSANSCHGSTTSAPGPSGSTGSTPGTPPSTRSAR